MAATKQDYDDAIAALKEGSGVSDEARAIAQEIRAEYEAANAETSRIVSRLNPDLPAVPQILATAPATTHPDGDQAAADEWVRTPGSAPKGTIMVYEPPLKVVRDRLASDEAFRKSLYPDVEIRPEEIANLSTDNDLYQAAANKYWVEAAEEASKAGRTAYRYSKAPWLQGGFLGNESAPGLGSMLVASTLPVMEGIQAFVLGADDVATIGGGRAALEAANPTWDGGAAAGGVGRNSPMTSPEIRTTGQLNDVLAEEHPVMHGLGQVYGGLAQWNPFNRLSGWLAGSAGATSAAGKIAAAAGANAVAEGANAVGRDVVNDLRENGELTMTPKDLGKRALWPAISGGAFGAAGEAGALGFDRARKWIAEGPRYGGMPGRLDQKGVEFSVTEGPKIDARTQKVIDEAKALDVPEGDISARDLAPAIVEGADKRVKQTIEKITQNKRDFYATPEGQQRIPVRNFMDRAVDILRRRHQPDEAGELLPIGKRVEKVRDIFNEHIAGVSTKPSEGAIRLTPEEAETFLATSYQKQLRPKKAGAESGGGARELDPTEIEAGGEAAAGGLAKDLRGRGVTEVYVVPQRYDAQRTEELLQNELKGSRIENKSYRELNELDEALRMDRDVRTLAGQKGGWSQLQAKHEELLRKVKGDEKLAAPNRDAFGPLVQSGVQAPGELPRIQAQRAAAEAAGPQFLQMFEAHRALDPLMTLRNQVQYGKVDGKRVNIFSPNSAADTAALRAYPLLKQLGGPMSVLRRTGGLAPLTQPDDEEKR